MNKKAGFTLIELLTVITIIAILMGLIISVAGMVQTKASRDRASAEIAAISTAMESYKADNGIYPQDADTDALVAKGSNKNNQTKAKAATLALYKMLSGDDDGNFRRDTTAEKQNPVYFEFETKKGMVKLSGTGGSTKVDFLQDPWGDSYGYSTAYAAELQKPAPADPIPGYNPTFDLWSWANAPDSNEEKWVKNW